jgi:RHS repeat-associated protein
VCHPVNGQTTTISRLRSATCPVDYTGTWTAPHCEVTGAALVYGRPLIKDCKAGCGNPINSATGDKSQSEVDLSISGLRFERTYHSATLETYHRLGTGWTHNYDARLLMNGGTNPVGMSRPDGSMESLRFAATGLYISESDRGIHVKKVGTEWFVYSRSGNYEVYDANGRLSRLVAKNGETTTLTYSVDKLTTVTGPYGHTLQFQHDSNGRIASVTDPGGQLTSFTYDSSNNLTAVTYPGSVSKTYHYENTSFPNHLTGVTDETGQRFSTFAYDSQGRGISTEHAGAVKKYTFSYQANSTVVTDPLNTTTTFNFTTEDYSRRVTSKVSSGRTTSFTVPNYSSDYQRRETQTTDARGFITKFVYDRDHVTSKTEAFGTPLARTTTYQYRSTDSDLPTQIDEPGKRTTFTYDTTGNVLTRTVTDTVLSLSRTWTHTYNGSGQVLTVNGPRTDVSDVTTYTYYTCTTGNACGNVQTVTNALNQTTTYNTYNAYGQPLTMTDANGVLTTLTYDARQRLASRTTNSEVTSFTYWPNALLKRATLPDGSFIDYTYDAAQRLTGVADADGNRVAYTLDNIGNRTSEESFDPSSALTNKRTRVFDTLNRLSQEIGAAGTPAVTTTLGYDNNDNQTTVAAPLSRSSTNTYDELNRLKQVTDPASGITQYGYNALDQLISVTDPRSKVTTYTYNALGDLVALVSPDTGTTGHTYDSGGNLATKTDARSVTTTYSYDALNRQTQAVTPDQTIGYQYDTGTNAIGRLNRITDNSGQTDWTYDAQGRVQSRAQTMTGVTKTLSYGYDLSGRLSSQTLPSGNVVTYGYTDGKVTSLTLNGSTTILNSVLYEPFGPSSGWTWGNSTLAVRVFDQDGKVTDIDSAGLKTYTYDDAFRITSITDAVDAAKSQSYGYDNLDRLTAATGTGLNQSWTYDANGNRLTQGGATSSTFTVSSSNNRLTSVTGALTKSYAYDAAGNTTADGTATFTYDHSGRMISSTKAGVTTAYSINALGQRVKKSNSSATTYFVYDEAGHLVGEYNSAGALIQEVVWFGDTPVATLRPNGAGVDLFYIHTDHLNTPRKITRPSDSAVVWSWHSDPFGTTAANENPSGNGTFVFNLRFPGQYADSEAGLNYNYLRDGYDSAVGRYTQSDPIGLQGGLNTYVYVENDPKNSVDPSGLARCTYSVSKHTLVCVSNDAARSAQIGPSGIFSGRSFCENQASDECFNMKDVGPVLPGEYDLVLITKGLRKGQYWLDEGFWNRNIGSRRNMRDSFFLHIGTSSKGCITVFQGSKSATDQWGVVDELLRAEVSDNTIKVVP